MDSSLALLKRMLNTLMGYIMDDFITRETFYYMII